MRTLLAPAAALALLSACDSREPTEEVTTFDLEGQPGQPAPLPPAPVGPSPEDLAILETDDCRTFAQGYIAAIQQRRFDYAAEFWDDPVIDAERLAALFENYRQPQITIADVQEEGAAGTAYCTVTGALADAADPARPLREGQFELSRVNDVPGASAAQLRWHLNASTYIEPMQRAGRGEPA